jgi:hypothetical protein
MRITLWPRKQSKPARRHANFRPRLEALEGRDVPSTLTVTNNLDSGAGSLRYEIAHARSNDTIVFDFGNKKANSTPHNITLTSGELDINKNLTIQGPGAGLLRIISQSWGGMDYSTHYGSRFFEVDAGTTVALSGLTMTGGGGTRFGDGQTGYPNDGYGGAVLNFGTLTLSNCTLGGNIAPGGTLPGNNAWYGGAIANFGKMTVTNCDVSGNTYGSVYAGGAIYNGGTLTVSGGDVSNNVASYGGGIYNTGTAMVSGCTLSGDTASQGGGIYNAGTAAALTVLDSIFSSNHPDNIFGPYTDGGGNSFN